MKDCEYLIDILPTEQWSTPQTAFENDRCAGENVALMGAKFCDKILQFRKRDIWRGGGGEEVDNLAASGRFVVGR